MIPARTRGITAKIHQHEVFDVDDGGGGGVDVDVAPLLSLALVLGVMVLIELCCCVVVISYFTSCRLRLVLRNFRDFLSHFVGFLVEGFY